MSDQAEPGATAKGEATEPRRLAEAAAGRWPGVGPLLAGLAGASVLVTGAALLIGWKYTEAFYGRLGVPTEALDLEPAAYLTAKIEIWYWLAASAVSFLVAWLFPLRPPDKPLFAAMLLIAIGMSTFFAGYVGATETGNGAFVYPCGLGAGLIVLGTSRVLQGGGDRNAAFVGMAGTVVLIFMGWTILSAVPEELGRHDAEAFLAGREVTEGAQVIAAAPLGLPGEHPDSGSYVTDGVRVVVATNSSYFVVVGRTEKVYCLPAAGILRMEYTPDEGR